jgi:hypothetical protein
MDQKMHTAAIVTKALQIAIQCRKLKMNAEQTLKDCREQLWRDYDSDTQAAVERVVNGFFGIKTRQLPKMEVKGKPSLVKPKRRKVA